MTVKLNNGQRAERDAGTVNQAIRKQALAARAALDHRQEKEKALAENLMPFFAEAKRPGFFMPVASEPDLSSLSERYPGYLLPKVISETQMLFWPAGHLKPGFMKIPEPDDPAFEIFGDPQISKTEKDEICTRYVPDVLLVPLSVFWKTWRMGYGKGYYDRYLSLHPGIVTIGAAFDEQEAEFIVQPWDQALDYIVTPTRILKKEEV